jgi:S-DNA-T family DNA segregation ATPase FtsK/SpoIIIE
VITSLAATHSPDELHIYILDFGGRGLDVLEALPHRAASIMPSEEERVQRLLRRLEGILEERKSILSRARADSLLAYNATHPDDILPAVLLVIDNFAEFRENYENQLDTLISIAREGRAYGVHLVATATQTNAMPGKLYSLFTERMTLKLADDTEYANIVGRGVPGIDDIAGRGFVAVERNPLELQIAVPVGLSISEENEGLDETTKLAMIAQIMCNAWDGPRPEGIDILRSLISLRNILPEIGRGPERVQTILGLEDLDLAPALLDLQQRGPHFLVTGPPLCGKTTTMRTWALALAHCYPPEQVAMVLIDFQQRLFKYGGDRTLDDLPHVLSTVAEAADLRAVIDYLGYEYEHNQNSRPEIFVLADNYDDFSNVMGPAPRTGEYRQLAELARKYGPEGLHFVMCGSLSIMRSMDDLIKQVVSNRYGLGLDAQDAPQALGGRVRSSQVQELPPGRGYVVKAGRLSMIQVAIPHDENDLEGSLDDWVDAIAVQYPQRARWYKDLYPPPEPEEPDDKDAGDGKGPDDTPSASGKSLREQYEQRRKQRKQEQDQ